MQPGIFAFLGASTFLGAALYINIVEQPARLALGPTPSVQEWKVSNRRGFLMLSVIAVISAMLAYSEYLRMGDVRWLNGGTLILAIWPYAYFVINPVNILLYAVPASARKSPVRNLLRDWGFLEWGQTAIALGACGMFGWALARPAEVHL